MGTWEACTSVDFVYEHFTTLDFFEGGQGQDLGELSIGTDDGVEVPAHQRRHSHVVTRGEEGQYVVPQLLWQGVRAFHLSVA